MKPRRISHALAAFSVLALLAACTNADPTPDPDETADTEDTSDSAEGSGEPLGDLVIALAGLETEVFDPHVVSQTAKIYQAVMYDWLVGVTPEGDFDNSLGVASEWAFSDDGLTWTATIRDGMTFWDGTPVTVDDAVFSLQRVIGEGGSSSGASTLRGAIASVEATGPDVMTVTLNGPFLFLPHLLSRLGATDGAVISKAHFESVGAEGYAGDPLGSGPYQLTDHVAGSSMTFTAVESHWSGVEPSYTTIQFQAVPEQQTRQALLERGDADIIGVSRQGSVDAEAAGFTILEKPDNANVHLNYHEQWDPTNPLSDIRVREAMNLAVNRDEIVEALLFGRANVVGIGHLGPAHVGWDESIVPPYPYDPERAQELLEESGYLANPVQIDVYSYERAEAPEIPAIMEAVVGYWSQVGLNVRLVRSEYGAVREMWGNKSLGPAVSVLGTANRVVFPVQLVWGSEGDLSYVQDPTLDGLIADWNSASTTEASVEAIQEVMIYVHENHISAPVVSVGSVYASSSDITPWEGLDGLYSGEIYLDGLFNK